MTKPKSALVVEDDESTREVLSDYLKQMGIEVIRAAANGQSAKKAMAKRLFDIIITDWKMTDGSGLALVNAIQTNNECLYQAILVCSGYLEPNDFSFLREFPCVDYLVKPVGYSQVRQGVVRVFEKSTWFRSRSTEVETAIGRLTTHRKESITELKSLLKDVPDQASFAFIIGKRLLTIGDYAHAEPFLRKASILEPDNGYFANNFARSLAGQGRHEEVLEILKDTRFSQQHFDRCFPHKEEPIEMLLAESGNPQGYQIQPTAFRSVLPYGGSIPSQPQSQRCPALLFKGPQDRSSLKRSGQWSIGVHLHSPIPDHQSPGVCPKRLCQHVQQHWGFLCPKGQP